MSTPTKKKKTAMALHVSKGDIHLVGIGNLRVVIVPDGQFWFAQGLEIDYAEQGDTIESVKKNFEHGLRATIEQHLKIHGTIKKLLRVAPTEVWTEVLEEPESYKNLFTQVSVHNLPFAGIQYLVAKEAANAAGSNG